MMDFFETNGTYEEPRARDIVPLEVVSSTPMRGSIDLPELSRIAREIGPRDLPAILEEARQIGAALGRLLPDDPKQQGTGAYYRWEVRGADGRPQVIEGPTIDLMDSLAGCWGRLAYQIEIVEERGQRVQLRARVIDLVSLVIHERPYVAHLRPPPAKFARSETESERWKVMQLQSAESKAIRGVLERVIPQSVQAAALEAARDAASAMQLGTADVLVDGKPVIDPKTGKPRQRRRTLPEAIDAAIAGLSRLQPPLSVGLVERWLGRPRAQWVAGDLGALRSLYARWRNGEVTEASLLAEASAAPEPAPEATHDAGDRLDSLGLGSSPSAAPPRGQEAGGASSAAMQVAIANDLDVLVRAVHDAGGMLHLATGRDRLLRPGVTLTEERWAAVLELGQQSGRLQIVGGTTLALPAPAQVAAARPPQRTSVGEDLDALIRGLQKAGGPVGLDQAKERYKAEAGVQRLASSRWDPIIELGVQLGRLRVEGELVGLVSRDVQPPVDRDAIDDMPIEEVEAECRALSSELPVEQVDQAHEAAGIAEITGAPDPALRRLLRELLKFVPEVS